VKKVSQVPFREPVQRTAPQKFKGANLLQGCEPAAAPCAPDGVEQVQKALFEAVDQVVDELALHLTERGAGGSVERRQRPRQQLTDAIVAHDGRVAQTLDERARDACAHRCD
jgi:hypothetical protein